MCACGFILLQRSYTSICDIHMKFQKAIVNSLRNLSSVSYIRVLCLWNFEYINTRSFMIHIITTSTSSFHQPIKRQILEHQVKSVFELLRKSFVSSTTTILTLYCSYTHTQTSLIGSHLTLLVRPWEWVIIMVSNPQCFVCFQSFTHIKTALQNKDRCIKVYVISSSSKYGSEQFHKLVFKSTKQIFYSKNG